MRTSGLHPVRGMEWLVARLSRGQVAFERLPSGQGIADGLCERALATDPAEGGVEKLLQLIEQRAANSDHANDVPHCETFSPGDCCPAVRGPSIRRRRWCPASVSQA